MPVIALNYQQTRLKLKSNLAQTDAVAPLTGWWDAPLPHAKENLLIQFCLNLNRHLLLLRIAGVFTEWRLQPLWLLALITGYSSAQHPWTTQWTNCHRTTPWWRDPFKCSLTISWWSSTTKTCRLSSWLMINHSFSKQPRLHNLKPVQQFHSHSSLP